VCKNEGLEIYVVAQQETRENGMRHAIICPLYCTLFGWSNEKFEVGGTQSMHADEKTYTGICGL